MSSEEEEFEVDKIINDRVEKGLSEVARDCNFEFGDPPLRVMKYNKSKYEIVYSIFIPEQLIVA